MPEKQGETKGVCFVIGPIGDEGTSLRERSDRVLRRIIEPAAATCGYRTVRADKMPKPGIITDQVMQQLLEAPIVVADLTDHNANVFYELAIRHAVKKPCVQIIQSGQSIPFDVAPTRTIRFDEKDWDSPDRCLEEIVRQIQTVETDPDDVDSPISRAVDLQALRGSKNPAAKSYGEIIRRLAELQAAVKRLSHTVAAIREHVEGPEVAFDPFTEPPSSEEATTPSVSTPVFDPFEDE